MRSVVNHASTYAHSLEPERPREAALGVGIVTSLLSSRVHSNLRRKLLRSFQPPPPAPPTHRKGAAGVSPLHPARVSLVDGPVGGGLGYGYAGRGDERKGGRDAPDLAGSVPHLWSDRTVHMRNTNGVVPVLSSELKRKQDFNAFAPNGMRLFVFPSQHMCAAEPRGFPASRRRATARNGIPDSSAGSAPCKPTQASACPIVFAISCSASTPIMSTVPCVDSTRSRCRRGDERGGL